MPSRKNHPPLFPVTLAIVTAIILGAFALSAASVWENLKFVQGTTQVLWFAKTVRSFVSEQKTISFTNGEDLWAEMVHLGQVSAATLKANPWQGDIRAIAFDNMTMRFETDLPSQDCRRMALYFAGVRPPELLGVEAQPISDTRWYDVYSAPVSDQQATAQAACGKLRSSRIAFVFKLK